MVLRTRTKAAVDDDDVGGSLPIILLLKLYSSIGGDVDGGGL